VHSIRARAVILDRAGVLERLDLPVQSDDSMAGLGAGRDEARAAKLTPAPALPSAFDPAALPVMVQGTAASPDDEPHADLTRRCTTSSRPVGMLHTANL
jgi:hypothetical protein